MAFRRSSLLLSARNAFEALAVSAPTVLDAVRGRLTAEACDRRLERFAARVMKNAHVDMRVHGRIPGRQDGRAYVVMSNHVSHYDIPVLYHVIGGQIRMVAKAELFHLPLFGQAIREAGMIEVDRKNHARAVASLEQAKTKLANGTNIWIAPEGTRSVDGSLLPFKKGGFILALDMKAPILPVTIVGTRDILPSRGLRSRVGAAVDVTFHAPIETTSYADRDPRAARDALMLDVRRAIASSLATRA